MSTADDNITFTDSVIKKVSQLIIDDGNVDLKLRIYIVGGGCSGFQYGFGFDENTNEDDIVIERHNTINGSKVVFLVDAMSMSYIEGATIDYTEGLQGERFVVSNPNAKTTCGCGSSFDIELED